MCNMTNVDGRGVARRLIPLLVAALALLAAPVAHAQDVPSPQPLPGLGIRLLEAPAHLQNDPRALAYIIDNLEPGTTISRRIEVSNNTGSPQEVTFYAGAARIEPDSGFFPEDGATPNELTTWISVDPASRTIPDGSTTEIRATIAVPDDAPDGEQYAVIWAEMGGEDPAGSGARLVNRVGIRVYLSVGDGTGPTSDFEVGTLTPRRGEDGSPEIVATATNTGGRALDIAGSVTLTDGPAGLSAGPVESTRAQSVAPGQTGQIVFRFDSSLPVGPWNAEVSLRSGLLVREAAAPITFPESGEGTAVDASDSTSGGVSLWMVALIALLAVIVLLLLLLLRRKTSKEQK